MDWGDAVMEPVDGNDSWYRIDLEEALWIVPVKYSPHCDRGGNKAHFSLGF